MGSSLLQLAGTRFGRPASPLFMTGTPRDHLIMFAVRFGFMCVFLLIGGLAHAICG